MIEILKEVLKGSATMIKNKQYLSTKDYISPFVDKLKDDTDKIICNVKMADQLSINNSNPDIIYNKVLVTLILKDTYDVVIDKLIYKRVICMAYALDVKIPVCKFYTGVIDSDGNFYAFGDNCLSLQKIEPDTPIDFQFVTTIKQNGINDNCKDMLKQIKDLTIAKNTLYQKLGEWVDFTIKKEYINEVGKVKLSSNMPIESYKDLTINKDSDYYIDEDNIPLTLILKSYLNQVELDTKELINRYEKTQLVNQLLSL